MREVITPDHRVLAVEEWGEPDGTPVLYLHGTPMSRLARHPDDELYQRLGIRLLTYDRPGYGNSTPHPGRKAVDAAADAVAILDELGLDRVPLIGISGGGPHALAVAAVHPTRATRVGILSSPAPRDAEGLNWLDGMMEDNRVEAEAATAGAAAVEAVLRRSDLATLPELPANEQAILSRPAVREMLDAAYAEAMRPGLSGAVEDSVALFGTSWGFDPAVIGVPVRIWHGEQDGVVPASHARWVAARIPTAELRCQHGIGHVGHFDAQPAMLAWLVDIPAPTDGPSRPSPVARRSAQVDPPIRPG